MTPRVPLESSDRSNVGSRNLWRSAKLIDSAQVN
jgi:hypothetical protein